MQDKLKEKKVLIVIALLIAGSWIGNLMYYKSMQLKEPLFLKHYITAGNVGGEMIGIHYLENSHAKDKIAGIQLAGLPYLNFQRWEKTSYSHQKLMEASATIRPEMIPADLPLPLVIRDATVFFDSGRSMEVPIGEIQIVAREDDGLLDFNFASSNGEYKVTLNKSATLEGIDYSYRELLEPWYELMESGVPVDKLDYPVRMAEGEGLSFSHNWSPPDDAEAAFAQFQARIILHFTLEDGSRIVEYLPINMNKHLSDEQVKRLVQSGGNLQ
ncbi:hypothetical protein M6D81_01105 [Paenibacillus sp. J5C_2022]|uniref:hypothetical protein n=1 Tax=Paenibacillus sp. J5C2022 TaxID=2977129 RepID=UPI0021D035DE|nr:hypothetical protein [Paenibacillus sp. J5C2022]MCU6707292.1 hypothetical protein [Paenibacillus sp. J5C2022]